MQVDARRIPPNLKPHIRSMRDYNKQIEAKIAESRALGVLKHRVQTYAKSLDEVSADFKTYADSMEPIAEVMALWKSAMAIRNELKPSDSKSETVNTLLSRPLSAEGDSSRSSL